MRTVILFFSVVIGVAAISALATRYFMAAPQQTHDSKREWLHEQLNLTEKQHEALEQIEVRFASEETRLRDAFNAANRNLATAIHEEGASTPRVEAAIENVHHQMGELQKLSVAHLFEMTTVLEPEQKEKLMHYAEIALTETH